MRTDLRHDPHVLGIAERLRGQAGSLLAEESLPASISVAVGCLHALWSWASEQTTDGRAKFIGPAQVDVIVGVPGFASAALEVGWLVGENGSGVQVPEFRKWLSHGGKRRVLAQRRMSKKRCADVRNPLRSERNESATTGCVTKAQPQNRTEQKRREHSEKTPHKPPKGGGDPEYPADFIEGFWQHCARKTGKAAALAAWLKLKPETRARLAEPTKAYAAAVAMWPASDRQFIPHPSTWLNEGRFDDDPATWVRVKPQETKIVI